MYEETDKLCEVSAYDDWKSLFTHESKQIWNQEPKEIRRVALLLHIIRQEFRRIENDFQLKVDNFKDLFESAASNSPKSEKRTVVHESPKINKRRRLKHVSSSPSLLNISKDKNPTSNNDYNQNVELLVLDSSCSETEDLNTSQIKPKTLFKQTKLSNKSNEDLLVDCSITLNEKSADENMKPKTDVSKWINIKKHKKPKQYTITKMFIKGLSKEKVQINEKTHDGDNTFCTFLENKNRVAAPKVRGFGKDYDIIPNINDDLPKYVHKTDVVRKKSERLKLPGWSCSDCEKFYESLDLSPRKLKQKMDACSKHRNKFPPVCETPQGFWDVTMPPTQDTHLT